MPTDQDAINALHNISEQASANRRREGTIVAVNGRQVSVVLDGEGTSILTAYRGSFDPALGAGVTIERVPGSTSWRVVGVRDAALKSVDTLPYDFERPGEALYYPLTLEAINWWSYNLEDNLSITIYNAFAINSNGDVQYDTRTFDLSSDVPVSDSVWAVFYMDDTTGVLTKFVGGSTSDPDNEWLDAVNSMMSLHYGVPGLLVLLDTGMTAWGDAWRQLRRGYLFGSKKIIRLPFSAVPNGSGTPTDAKYVTTEAEGALYNEIVIPGLAGSADVVGVGGSTVNNEFHTTTPGLTWNSAPDVVNSHTVKPSHLYVEISDATERFGMQGFAPAGDWSVVAKLDNFMGDAASNDLIAGICVNDAADTSRLLMTIARTSAYVYTAVAYHYTSPTLTSVAVSGALPAHLPVYLHMDYISGVVYYYYSMDGYVKRYLGQATFAITVANVGYRILRTSGSGVAGIYSDFLRASG